MSRASESLRAPLSRRAFTCAGLFACAGLLSLSGCGSNEAGTAGQTDTAGETDDPASAQDESAQADKLIMGITVDPDGLDPQRTAAAATFQVTSNVYDPLLKVTTSGELVPGLAESWETSEDGLVATFKLREGLVFSNGNACDAQAVVASFQRLQDDAAPRKSEYAGYTFEAVDERTVQVTSSELNVAMLTDFAYAWSAVVDTTVADTLANQPVGTGPYKVVSWTPQQSVVLEANPSYWGEASHIANVELRVLPEATTQASSLRAHDVDLILAANEQVAAFEGDTAFQIMQYPMNGVQLMAMNCANEVLADVRVRQAINMAVDKDALIEAVWWGYGKKIGSHFPPSFTGYVDCNDTYAYDPDAAKALLEECGYSAEELTFSMRLPKSYKEYVNAGQIIADALGKVGITCNVEIVEWATWLDEVYTGRVYDLTVVGHTGRLDPITLLARYGSDSSENYFNYSSDVVDGLIADYRGQLDEGKRAEDVRQIQEQLAQDVPALYIQSPVMVYLADAGLEGFVQYPIDIYEFKDVKLQA